MAATNALFATPAVPATVAGRREQCLHVHDQIVAFHACAGGRLIASVLRAR